MAASSQDYAKKLDEATSSNDIDQLEVLLDERELRLLMVREDGTYIQTRIMQHYSSIIHSELGNKAFDFHMPISEMNERKYKDMCCG